jgi:hypothetical protein
VSLLALVFSAALGQQPAVQTLENGLVAAECRCVLRDMPANLLTTPTDGDPVVTTNDDEFIAAFWEHPPDALSWKRSMGVLAGNKATGRWTFARLPFDADNDPTHATRWPGPIDGVRRSNGITVVSVRIALDAVSTILLDLELHELGRIFGRNPVVLRTGLVLYQRTQPRAARTHYVELVAYDTRTRRHIVIFPRQPYSEVRTRFIARTKIVYDRLGPDGCAKMNHHCDPELFNSYMDAIAANTAGDTVAFVMHYQDDVFVAEAGDGETAMAVCQGLENLTAVSCRETPLAAWRHAFPDVSEDRLPTYAAQSPRTVR